MGVGEGGLFSHGLLPVPCYECLGPLLVRLHCGEIHRHLSPHEGPGAPPLADIYTNKLEYPGCWN